ncbi:MAG: hypothetical protein ACR2KS_03285 [Candidatus Eremiobacter antarcticus]|nr:hypothetical protein [Candidatus Eremiobacteraeota bacterium]
MRHRFTIITSIVLCLIALGSSVRADRSASYALRQALNAVQSLDGGSILALRNWASSGNLQPPTPIFFPQDKVEAQIAALERRDRDAIVTWINGGGRGQLYVRGATDSDIGPCLFPIDSGNCQSASNGGKGTQDSRELNFVLTADNSVASGITIVRGFGMAKNDGTGETHCLAFKNTGTKTATSATFTYALLDADTNVLSTGTNVRTGSFSTNAVIAGPSGSSNYSDLRGGLGNKSMLDNCWTTTSSLGVLSIFRAVYVSIHVSAVKYDDGTTWTLTH